MATRWWLVAGLAVWPLFADRQNLSCAEMEAFLREAKIGVQRDMPKGVTVPKRATLDNGSIKHDASIQPVNIQKASYQTQRGTELNFRDFYGFNVAGYEVAKLLDMNMVPPYVERKVGGNSASMSWMIDDAMMELDRVQKKMNPPDLESWNRQMYAARVFTQLIGNVDDNLTNFLITKDWQLWLIDFSRAFRSMKTLPNAKNLVQCDRKLLANLRKLDRKTLEEKLVKPRYINKMELDGLMARRDKIVEVFDKEIAQKGEAAVLFDLPRIGEACGTGL